MITHSNNRWVKFSSHRFSTLCWIIGCFLFVILVLATIQYRESCLQTNYTERFTDERFKIITEGMPVKDVFDQLGLPFLFRVPSLGGRGYFTNLADVLPNLSSGTNKVVLEYSRPRKGDTYRARQIVVSDGRVVKVDAYEYWGD
jgi:hypothetical protein